MFRLANGHSTGPKVKCKTENHTCSLLVCKKFITSGPGQGLSFCRWNKIEVFLNFFLWFFQCQFPCINHFALFHCFPRYLDILATLLNCRWFAFHWDVISFLARFNKFRDYYKIFETIKTLMNHFFLSFFLSYIFLLQETNIIWVVPC